MEYLAEWRLFLFDPKNKKVKFFNSDEFKIADLYCQLESRIKIVISYCQLCWKLRMFGLAQMLMYSS